MSAGDETERTAAVLLIGNELLSGKTRDTNAHWLAQRLYQLGVRLRRVEIVPDEVPLIAEAVRRLADTHDWLFTSGGVGPTHDDMTISSVARAFEVPVVRVPELEAGIRRYQGERVTEGYLRMADAPEGYRLTDASGVRWPVMSCRNVYILPGVPSLFQRKFEAIQETFRQAPIHLRQLFLQADEGAIAPLLEAAHAAYPNVEVGSYPDFNNPSYRLKVTVEGRAQVEVDAVFEKIRAGLDDDQIVPAAEV